MGLRERFRYEITSLNPEVTGSCHLITVHYPDGRMTNFIVDSGLYQEAEYSHLNDRKLPFSCEKIKFVLITHNHADHMGRLPYLVRSGFQGPIYATTETTRLMKTALHDSFGILKDEAERRKRKPPYDETDLQRTFEMFMNCEFD